MGYIREEERHAISPEPLSEDHALLWAQSRARGEIQPVEYETENPETGEIVTVLETIEDHLINEEAEEVERRRGSEAGLRYHCIAMGTATPFQDAVERYRNERDNLSLSTLNDLKTEAKRFEAFAGTYITLQEVDRAMVYQYMNVYLRGLRSPRAPNGLRKTSIERSQSLLSGLWRWAIRSGVLPYETQNPWRDQPVLMKVQTSRAQPREKIADIFTPEQWRKLVSACPAGSALSDAMHVAIFTGCRLGEIAELRLEDLEDGVHGLFIPAGKTSNARRFVPLFGAAHRVLKARVGDQAVLFPELPVKPANGKRSPSLTKKFTRLRRKVLGVETDGNLKFHSIRHTWRTLARRSSVDDRTAQELGGWAGQYSTDRPYDHGLAAPGYRRASWAIIETMASAGYFDLPERPNNLG